MTLQQQAVESLGFVPNLIYGEFDYKVEGDEWGVRVYDTPIARRVVCCYDGASVYVQDDGYARPWVQAHAPSCDSITAIRWAIRIAAEYNRLKDEQHD